MSFGMYFRELRKSKQITQKQLASAIEKTPMLISGIETNKNGPFSDEDLKKIADYMKLTEAEYSDLLIRASNERGKLPPHIADYIAGHREAYSILEVLAQRKVGELSLKKLRAYAEELE
ncbi:helix-turn-helix transcriptional regulator [[Clostridium] symbiosum]|uniref:helix-turn-helix domain-containing protein n=1 Tax=Clostridium symbiosum TaxID=1512 RepID=UPI00189FF2CF|nr:helix-turn-helix transcriptional regulator [[Clostridium] symbiosum]MDB2038328.1 helix-turn-helix transcriptional regulator [[Clostridium] symbiosum]DAT32647.1 MAG TPA: helix-turn-helix domain protein [Caudoviricetes sp.]